MHCKSSSFFLTCCTTKNSTELTIHHIYIYQYIYIEIARVATGIVSAPPSGGFRCFSSLGSSSRPSWTSTSGTGSAKATTPDRFPWWQPQIFRENMGFKWGFYLIFDHPHVRSIDVGKIGFIAATSPKIGVTCGFWSAGRQACRRCFGPSARTTSRPGPWGPCHAGRCRVDDRSPKCLKSILSLF